MHMHAVWTGSPKMRSHPQRVTFFFFWWKQPVLTLENPQRQRSILCRKYTLPCRQQNKWSSSYQSEENNNPGLDLSSAVNDRGNYAHIARQANRITVRFSLWLGCHSPIIVVSPDWSSPSQSPLPFTACLVSSFLLSRLGLSSLFSGLVLRANEFEADGRSLAPARPPSRSVFFYFFLFSSLQRLHSLASRGNLSVHHSSPAPC